MFCSIVVVVTPHFMRAVRVGVWRAMFCCLGECENRFPPVNATKLRPHMQQQQQQRNIIHTRRHHNHAVMLGIVLLNATLLCSTNTHTIPMMMMMMGPLHKTHRHTHDDTSKCCSTAHTLCKDANFFFYLPHGGCTKCCSKKIIKAKLYIFFIKNYTQGTGSLAGYSFNTNTRTYNANTDTTLLSKHNGNEWDGAAGAGWTKWNSFRRLFDVVLIGGAPEIDKSLQADMWRLEFNTIKGTLMFNLGYKKSLIYSHRSDNCTTSNKCSPYCFLCCAAAAAAAAVERERCAKPKREESHRAANDERRRDRQ